MVRIRNSVTAQKRKKRVLKKAKGQFGHRSTRYRQAKRSVIKGMTYAYRDRKVKKREFKRLWIIRINAACQESGVTYSRFINGLKKANIDIDRKVLSELAISSPAAFKRLVKLSKENGLEKPAEKEEEAVSSQE
ncbi:MAG: 50S ribosomal protein L20 [Candidatus Omnitrophica bacterium]|nr:50S ribosomal protein L20 [Candidatus Omnitrophota bacterium]MCK5178039.1 50S ribosomal protein L20 [Candidatus Omnitrophota bacterium]